MSLVGLPSLESGAAGPLPQHAEVSYAHDSPTSGSAVVHQPSAAQEPVGGGVDPDQSSDESSSEDDNSRVVAYLALGSLRFVEGAF